MSQHISAYRADIDGLRALAVLSVFLFHLNGAWLPSGFLGVDIFFVLSGYLISSTLYKDIAGGRFSFSQFYIRRIRRILPAFFFATLVALVGGSLLFIAKDLLPLKKSVVAALAFASNFYFMRKGGYFATGTEDMPLLHIWSLSVEEQFYFLFPMLLILLLWLFKRRSSAEGPRMETTDSLRGRLLKILVPLCLLLLSSAFLPLKDWGISWDPYYLPHLRFGELLIGSIFAVALTDRPKPDYRPWHAWVGSLSLLVLLVCMPLEGVFVSPLFPGLLAVIPCVALGMLIYTNQQDYWVSRFFSWKPVVWIGKISYSLYLWHWIVIVFFSYFAERPIAWQDALWIIPVTFALASFSYYIIEQPLRYRKITLRQGLLYYYALPACLCLGLVLTSFLEYPMPEKYQVYSKAEMNFDNIDPAKTFKGDTTQPAKVLIAGDSHTAHLLRFFEKLGRDEHWSAYVSAAASCPFLLDYTFVTTGQREGFAKERNELLAKEYKKYPVIILSSLWGSPEYMADSTYLRQLDYTLGKMTQEGKKVYFLVSFYARQHARLRESYLVARGFTQPNPNRYTIADLQGEMYAEAKANVEKIEALIREKHPQVKIINLEELLPPTLLEDGMPVLADTHHLNDYGAEVIARRYQAKYGRLIPESDLQP